MNNTQSNTQEVTNVSIPTIDTNMSPYAFAEVADVRPQMVYNYIKKGWIKASVNDLGKKYITPEDGNAWLIKYYEKNRLAPVTTNE